MADFTIYTIDPCPYCRRVKGLLAARGHSFEEVSLTGDMAAIEALRERTGHMTLPQVFRGQGFLGGCDEVEALLRAGSL
jgi:glutaredoxin 3